MLQPKIMIVGMTLILSVGSGVAWSQSSSDTRKIVSDEDHVFLDPAQCKPMASDQKKWLEPDWGPFLRYAITCPVRNKPGPPALFVVSIDAYQMEQSLPRGASAPHYPKARVLAPDGKAVAVLPYDYPFDPPLSLDLTFTQWQNNFPRTIQLWLEDPTVSGNRALPSLHWSDTIHQYQVEGNLH
jgi:hypothetical protein